MIRSAGADQLQDIAQHIKKEVGLSPLHRLLSLNNPQVRPEEGCYMALHSRQKLRKLRYPWYDIIYRECGPELMVLAETRHFIYFYLGHNAILLFKTQ